MEVTEEEDKMMYIYFSKKKIDEYTKNNQYHAAFNLLILVLRTLDNDERTEFIDYYSKNTKVFDFVTDNVSEN